MLLLLRFMKFEKTSAQQKQQEVYKLRHLYRLQLVSLSTAQKQNKNVLKAGSFRVASLEEQFA